jgi:hypothetical protein
MFTSRNTALLSIALWSIASVGQNQSLRREQVSACEVLEHPEKFDGRVISTRLITGNALHEITMFVPECGGKSLPSMQPTFFPPYTLDSPADKAFRRSLDHNGAVWVTVEGKFIGSGGPFGAKGKTFKIEVYSIQDVHKISLDDRKRWDVGTGKSPD